MAILKDLIVHGSSRFLNKIYASEIQTPLIEAEAGIFKKLKADDATVVGLLDVKGQLHTNSWSNSNIATIDGSFYITPTIGSDSGTVTITATSLNFSGTNYAVTSLYLGDNSSITWPQYSKVLVTGQILSNGEWIPLGTLLGQLSAQAAAASIKINNIKDNKNQTSSVLAILVNNGTTSSDYRNLKVSLYQRASSSTAFYPLGIYITATGTNGRTFLDIYGGVESLENNANHGGFAEPNVRIGNLQGLPNVGGQSPNGWGIYTDNGYFKGIIAADRGYIGTGSKYWVIENYEDGSNSDNDRSYIYNGTNSTTSTIEGVYLGTDGIRNYKDSTHYVTIKKGVISALGADLSGKIIASSGSIGGWNIGTDTNKSLYHGNQIPGATTTNLVLSPTSATNSNAIGGSATGLNWFLSAGKVFGVTTSGALYATSGKIGSWEIGSNYLLTGTWGTGESALLSTGSSLSKKIGGSDLINNWVFTAGANFGVTKSGALYASSANISGKITATSGEIGGITIDNNGKLWITDANISGTISGDHIDASSISIGSLNGVNNYAQKIDIAQAIDNIEVGGRNLLKEFDCLAPVQTSKGITITYNGNGWFNVNGIVTGTSAGVLCFYGSTSYTSNIIGSGNYILSIETDGTIFLPPNKTFIQLAYHSDNATNNTIAGEFEILSDSTKVTFTIPENHHISRVCLFIQANATDGIVDGNIRLKLEKGNKATDWTPAPEDVVNEAVNKVEVGGRNLIRNSADFDKWVVKNGGANGDIWSRSVSGNTSNVNLRPRTWIGTGNLADYYNKTLVVSFEIMSPDWSAIEEGSSNTGLNGLAIQLETASGTPYSSSIGSTGRYFFKRLGDKNYFKTDSDLVDGEWVKITSVPLKIDDTLWNNSTTLIDGYDYFTFSFILRRNGTISFRKPQIEIGNKATDWTPAPEDTQEDINNISTVANTALGQSVWYAECSTAAGTAVKVATISPVTTSFVLTKGATVNVKFTNTNSATNSSLQLNINGTGAKNIKYIYNGSLTNIPKEYLKANQMYQFRYDGTYWVVQMMYNSNNYDRSLYSLPLAASEVIAAGKIAVLGLNNKLIILKSTPFYINCPPLYVGTTYEQTHVTNANTKTNNYTYWGNGFNLTNTHSIQSAAANTNVYIVGTLSGDIFTPNTTVLTCAEPTTEDGLYYMLLGRMTSTTNAMLQAEHPIYIYKNRNFQKLEATTATSYITYIDANDGIKVHNESDTLNYLQLNSTAISMYRNRGDGINSDEVLRIDNTGIRIGKINKPHFSIMGDKLIGYGNNSNIYFEVGKGDNANVRMFYGVYGDETSFEIGPIIKNIEYVKKEGNLLTEGTDYEIDVTSTFYDILFDTNPSLNSTITINYKSLYHSDVYSIGSSSTTNVEINTSYQTLSGIGTKVIIKPKKSYQAVDIKIKKSGRDYWQDTSEYTIDQEGGYYIYDFSVNTVNSGDQIKLQYLVSQNSELTPDTIVENYTWDSSLQKLGYLSVNHQINQILSVAVNNNILTLNEDYTLEGPLKYGYLILSQPLAIGEKAEIRFTTRDYNSQYDSIYLNFSNKNIEDGVKGINAASFGSGNVNKGAFSLVEGVDNIAAGYAVHVEGYDNIATGSHAHAEGEGTKALSLNSHASGQETIVTGINSYAGGYSTIASSSNQHVIGKFNIKDTNNQYAFIVGNGIADDERSNSFAVDWNGGVEIGGNLTINGRKPFLLVQKTYTRTITANSACYISQQYASPTGYIPIGIIDWGTFNGTYADYCVMGHAYVWRGNPNTIDIYVWNQHPSQSATNVVIFVNILCIANTFL